MQSRIQKYNLLDIVTVFLEQSETNYVQASMDGWQYKIRKHRDGGLELERRPTNHKNMGERYSFLNEAEFLDWLSINGNGKGKSNGTKGHTQSDETGGHVDHEARQG